MLPSWKWRRAHADPARLAQLGQCVVRLYGDSGLRTAGGHRLGDGGIGVTGEIDPLGPAFPDRLAGLLHADDLLLGSKLRDHGKFLLKRMVKSAES